MDMIAHKSPDSRCYLTLEDGAPNNQPKILLCFTFKIQKGRAGEELKSWAEENTDESRSRKINSKIFSACQCTFSCILKMWLLISCIFQQIS